MEIDPRALTEDGYLKDQDYLKNFPYGRYPTSFNGCGWVAIYNVEHAIGQSIAAEAVYEVMRKMLPYDGTQGTPFPTMVRYYAKYPGGAQLRERRNLDAGGARVRRTARHSPLYRGQRAALHCLCARQRRDARALSLFQRGRRQGRFCRDHGIFSVGTHTRAAYRETAAAGGGEKRCTSAWQKPYCRRKMV